MCNCQLCEEDSKQGPDEVCHIEQYEIEKGTRICDKCGTNVCVNHSISNSDSTKYICLNCI